MITVIRAIDLESSHLSPAEGGLVEIGYADIVARSIDLAGSPCDWEVVGGRGRLCNPGVPIPPETQAIHHIADEDVAGEPNWKSLFSALLKRAAADGVIAYAAFGADFEVQWMHPDWLGPTPPPMVDVYKAVLRVWPEAPGHSNRVIQYWRKPVGLAREDGLPAHRAYPDALVTAFTLRDLLNDGVAIETMIEWTALPALTVRCYLGDWRNDGKGTPWTEVDDGFLDWIVNKAMGGFRDKPDIRYTAEYHIEQRRAAAALERERADLNAQLRTNGLDEIPNDLDAPTAPSPEVDNRQESLL
ncbi:MAG: 3'-5' exonuclease [Minisyncoccota bacterium]